MTVPAPVLVVEHVGWERPHRIAAALTAEGLDLRVCRPLEGDPLPRLDEVSAAVLMGGPMNVDQVADFPALEDERRWLAEAIPTGLPILGVCLGSQLIARALGATVHVGHAPEIGWLPVVVSDPSDPLIGGLAPETMALHWHGDVFDLPAGAVALASSGQTAVQAFRHTNAWGILFHAEADRDLVDMWLDQPSMRDQAVDALGPQAAAAILSDADRFAADLAAASDPGFAAFAALIA